LYSLLKFRAAQSKVVDFGAVYNGKDEERERWKFYFRRVWVEMAERVFLNLVIVKEGLALERRERDSLAREVEIMWGMIPRGRWLMGLSVGDEGELPVWEGLVVNGKDRGEGMDWDNDGRDKDSNLCEG
jgi:hypothetical protein